MNLNKQAGTKQACRQTGKQAGKLGSQQTQNHIGKQGNYQPAKNRQQRTDKQTINQSKKQTKIKQLPVVFQ